MSSSSHDRFQYYPLIKQELQTICSNEQIQLVAAAEFGSGVNDLASPTSDFDVVFIYFRPLDSYFYVDQNIIRDRRDTLRFESLRVLGPDGALVAEVDAQGFDIRTALKMFREGNLSILDLLASDAPIFGSLEDRQHSPPIEFFFATARHLLALQNAIMTKSLGWQLWGKAGRHEKQFFGSRWTTKITAAPCQCVHKKYFYVIVPLLRLHWLRAHRPDLSAFAFPPFLFESLIPESTPLHVVAALHALAARKREGRMGDEAAPSIDALDPWITHLFQDLQPFLEELATSAREIVHQPFAWDRFWFDFAILASGLKSSS